MIPLAKYFSLIPNKVTKWNIFYLSITLVLIIAISILYYKWQEWFPWYWGYFVFEYKNDMIGIPYFLPLLSASVFFWWRGSLITWVICIAILLPRLIHYHPNLTSIVINVVFLFLPFAIVIIIALETNWRKKQREITEEREKERQSYMAQILKAQEDERGRIARELHDETTQELLVLANRTQKLVSILNEIRNREGIEQAEWIRDKILNLSEDLREISHDLRPGILDNAGLVPALEWLTDRLHQETNIDARLIVDGKAIELLSETEIHIFRLVQEALNNVRRHANATEVVINLKFDSSSLIIKVQDNGKGFSLDTTLNKSISKRNLGIAGMLQRARLIDGTLDIQSELGTGTAVSLNIRLGQMRCVDVIRLRQ